MVADAGEMATLEALETASYPQMASPTAQRKMIAPVVEPADCMTGNVERNRGMNGNIPAKASERRFLFLGFIDRAVWVG